MDAYIRTLANQSGEKKGVTNVSQALKNDVVDAALGPAPASAVDTAPQKKYKDSSKTKRWTKKERKNRYTKCQAKT